MDATITLVKANITQNEVDQVVALAKNKGWTVEWTVKGTG